MARFTPRDLLRAEIYRHKGDYESAKRYYESARNIIEAKMREQPEDDRSHRYYSSLGIAYAGLGLKQKAIQAGKHGVELLPLAKDASGGLSPITDLARIYAMVDEPNLAIDQIQILLDKPSGLSVHLLKLDPAWEDLRQRPRFKKLVQAGE